MAELILMTLFVLKSSARFRSDWDDDEGWLWLWVTCCGGRTSARSGSGGGSRGEERPGESSGTGPLQWGSGPPSMVWAAGLEQKDAWLRGAWASKHLRQWSLTVGWHVPAASGGVFLLRGCIQAERWSDCGQGSQPAGGGDTASPETQTHLWSESCLRNWLVQTVQGRRWRDAGLGPLRMVHGPPDCRWTARAPLSPSWTLASDSDVLESQRLGTAVCFVLRAAHQVDCDWPDCLECWGGAALRAWADWAGSWLTSMLWCHSAPFCVFSPLHEVLSWVVRTAGVSLLGVPEASPPSSLPVLWFPPRTSSPLFLLSSSSLPPPSSSAPSFCPPLPPLVSCAPSPSWCVCGGLWPSRWTAWVSPAGRAWWQAVEGPVLLLCGSFNKNLTVLRFKFEATWLRLEQLNKLKSKLLP